MIAELVRTVLALLASLPLRIVPRALRFAAGLRLARLLTPLIGDLLLRRLGNVVGSALDETTRACFRAIARMKVKLDTAFIADIDRDVLATVSRGAAVFVTAHFPVNGVFTRWLFDAGHPPVLVRDDDGLAPPVIWGTSRSVEVIHPHGNVMLQMRRVLLEGKPLMLAIDRARPGVRSLAFDSRFGETVIATPVFTLAGKMGVPLFFFGARVTADGLPVLTVRRIPYDPQAFADEFRRHTAQMLP